MDLSKNSQSLSILELEVSYSNECVKIEGFGSGPFSNFDQIPNDYDFIIVNICDRQQREIIRNSMNNVNYNTFIPIKLINSFASRSIFINKQIEKTFSCMFFDVAGLQNDDYFMYIMCNDETPMIYNINGTINFIVNNSPAIIDMPDVVYDILNEHLRITKINKINNMSWSNLYYVKKPGSMTKRALKK